MGELVVVVEAKVLGVKSEVKKELPCALLELGIVRAVRALLAEPLVLHLLEFDGAEDEVAGRDLVAERLADLRDAEGDLGARRALHVQKVDEFALRRLGAQIDFVLALVGDAARGLKHQVEGADGRPVALAADGAADVVLVDVCLHLLVGHQVGIDLALGVRLDEVVGAVTALAVLAVHLGVGKARGVTARFPDARVHEDGGVHAVGIVALLHEALPPCAFDVVLDLHTHGAVVPGVAHAAVDLAAGENDAARLAQRDEFVHRDCFVCHDLRPYRYRVAPFFGYYTLKIGEWQANCARREKSGAFFPPRRRIAGISVFAYTIYNRNESAVRDRNFAKGL